MTPENLNTYDFLINDEDEAMLLLYAREGEPKDAVIDIDYENKSAVLHRRPDDSITLEGISDEVLDSLEDADKLLICELSSEDNEDETSITYAYEADITD